MSTEGNMSPYQMFLEGLSAIHSDTSISNSANYSPTNDANIDVPDRVTTFPCSYTIRIGSFLFSY